MKKSQQTTITLASLCLGLVLGLVITGGGGREEGEEAIDLSQHRQPTRRVVPSRDGLGISSFLARNARRENLPIGYRDKRTEMHERRTSPFRLQAVLYHHMDNLSDMEVEELIANKELVTDREVGVAYHQIAQEQPAKAMDLAIAHSNNLHQKLLAMRSIYGTWAKEDPEAMFDYISKMNTGGQRMIHTHHLHLAWLNTDPGGMTENYKKFPRYSQNYIAGKAMRTWLNTDRQAATDFASSRTDPREKEMFERIVRQHNPPQ